MITILHSQLHRFAFISTIPCDRWPLAWIWLYGGTEGLLAFAYVALWGVVGYCARQQHALFASWRLTVLSLFILASGLAHGVEVWTLWHPRDLWLLVGVKGVTATLAIAIVGVGILAIPTALRLLDSRELATSHARLRHLAANIPGAVFRYLLRPDGTDAVLYMSPGCYGLWEVEASQVEQDATVLWQMIHPDDLPGMQTSVLESAHTLQPWSWSWRIQTPSGCQKWLEAIGRPEQQANGEVIWDTVILDVTDRKQSEVALAASKQRYKDLLENSPDIIERFDLHLRHLYVSPVLTALTGIETEVFLGKTCREMGMDETMTATWEAAATRLLATGEKQTIEFLTPTLKGVRSFEMVIAPEWEDQKIQSILCISRDITDRKQAETQLRNLAVRLELAVQSAKMGIWDWDIGSDRLTWDDRLYELYGVQSTGFSGAYEAWVACIHPDDLPMCLAYTQHILVQETTDPLEFRVVRPDGIIRYIESRAIVQRDEQGQPLRMIGVNIDISERKAAETELRQQKELLQSVFDHLPVMLGVYSAQGDILLINDELERVIGWSKEDYRTVDVLRACYPNPTDYDQVLAHIMTANSTWKDFKTQVRDGRILETSWAQIRLSDGRSIGIGQDITERKKAEEARLQAEKLRLELNLLERILDRVLAGYWDTDFSNHTNYWSPGLKRMFGYAEDELPDDFSNWQKLLFAEDLPGVLECFEHHIQSRGQQPYYNEVRYQHKDGSTVWVLCAGEVIEWDDQGQPLRMVGCHVDITKLKQAEAQLLQTTAQLEVSNRELEAFAYSVSHDLRAPLRAIDGFSKALLEDYGDRVDAEGKDYFDRIRHNVQRMGLLIDDLLRLSRVSRCGMQQTTVNLSHLVQEQAAELQALDPDRQVEFVIAPDAIVTADPTLMRVVITNLLANAWKFTSQQDTARIEFGIIKENDSCIYFVHDDGAGFDMTYAAKLFGVFQRLHNTHEFPGTGIGLATVQRAVHRHGGQVWAKGVVGQGATIYFTVPGSHIRTRG